MGPVERMVRPRVWLPNMSFSVVRDAKVDNFHFAPGAQNALQRDRPLYGDGQDAHNQCI